MKINKYLLALACGIAVSAHAENNFYVLGSVGQSHVKLDKGDFDSELENEGFIVNSSDLDKDDTGYKIQFGYQFNPYFAVEGGYVDFGSADYKANVSGVAAKAEFEATGWNINVLGLIPFTDTFSLVTKFGFIRSDVDVTVSASAGGVSISESESGKHISTLFGFGAQYAFTKNLAVRAEFENYNAVGDDSKTGEANIQLISAGVAFKF